MADAQSNPPAVSVLMPVRNCGSYIEEAVDCILRQTFADFEFLIVDDASTDDTWERLKQFSDPRIRLFRNETNKGLAQNLNDLLAIARGEFIARMDGDDKCALERLELQVSYLRAHPEVGVVGTYFLYMSQDGRDTGLVCPPHTDAAIKDGMLDLRTGVLHPSATFRKGVLQSVGGYRPAIGIAEDQDLFLRLRDHCQMSILPTALYRWRMHSSQTGTRVREQQAAILMLRMYAVERQVIGDDSLHLMDESDLARIRSGAFIMPRLGTPAQQREVLKLLGRATIADGRPAQAYRLAASAVRKWPLSSVGYTTALATLLSIRSYQRTIRRCKNACGRFVYRVLRVKP